MGHVWDLTGWAMGRGFTDFDGILNRDFVFSRIFTGWYVDFYGDFKGDCLCDL